MRKHYTEVCKNKYNRKYRGGYVRTSIFVGLEGQTD